MNPRASRAGDLAHPTRGDAAAVALLAVAVLARWWRVLPGIGGGHFEAGDFVDQFFAFAHFEVAELAAGRLPVWNPHAYAGSPFWADIQAAVAYPPSLIVALTAAWTRGGLPYRALELEAVAHVLLVALGTYLFARRALGRRGPAMITALAFGLGGWVNGYPPLQLAVLEAAAWLPFALWGISRTIERPRDWPLPALALGMCVLAGHPQTTLYVGYTTAAWAAWLSWRRWREADSTPREATSSAWDAAAAFVAHASSRLVALAAAALGALGLSAAGWLPAAAFLRRSNRAEAGYDMLAHGFPPAELLGIVLPGITKWAPLYVGLVPLGLALLAIGRTLFDAPAPRSTRRGDTPFWIGLLLVSLLLSLGRNGILFDLFYLLAPGFDLFRGQERAAMLASFALAMLAGAGASLAADQLRERRGRQPHHEGHPRRGEGLALAAVLLLTLLDLLRVGGTTNLTPNPPGELRPAPAQMILAQAGLTGRVHDHPDRWERRWPPNAGMLHGYASLDGASPLRLRRYDALRAAVADDERRLWELLAVSHVLSGRQDLAGATKLMALDDGSALFALDAPWPRAWRVPAAAVVDDAEAAVRMADPAWDPMAQVMLAEGDETAAPLDGVDRVDGADTLTRVTIPAPGEVRIATEGPRAAWIVVSEIHDPAWRASVDGQPAAVRRADLGLLAVEVPAGAHELVLRYRPRTVPWGIGLSLVSALVLLATAFQGRRPFHRPLSEAPSEEPS